MSDGNEKNSTVENFQTMEEIKREHFFKAMKLAGGNKNKAAKLLGITVKSTYNMSDRYFGKTLETVKQNQEIEGEEI